MTTTVTAKEVMEIAGPLDDLRVLQIVDTGATAAEVLEARAWTIGDRRSIGGDEPLREAIVELVFDILRAEDPEWDE